MARKEGFVPGKATAPDAAVKEEKMIFRAGLYQSLWDIQRRSSQWMFMVITWRLLQMEYLR